MSLCFRKRAPLLPQQFTSVTEGPWTDSIDEQMKRVQRRLYDAIDSVLDGQLADKYPELRGKDIVIRLDGIQLSVITIIDGRSFTQFEGAVFTI